ncbi:Fis family transcriptional regulator [Burkholderia sp. Leaf177]|uniref:sigma-54 dependent transcriptional regulator n=1 Tax=Burkholderia sp. Leaf177 TaxID=1736287 RepID=UPI0006F9FE62|nr:sigma-54 dependent transcriptional regulator [Burkholderia sp. Leaf177]KQR78388.1 Fis family transcriptional regulator [Burkholderia sp. Leaf177]
MAAFSSSPRHLYYVGDPLTLEVRSLMDARGWTVRNSELGRDLESFSMDPSGGLLDFSSRNVQTNLRLAETMLAIKTIGWVALLTPVQLDNETIRRLIRDFCFDYVTLPASGERILNALGHAYGIAALHDGGSRAGVVGGTHGNVNAMGSSEAEGEMIGSCDAMLALFRAIRKVAITDAPVFISGESGTGKELTAAAIHRHSTRRDQPFVAINCGAIPTHLLQSELFGYERGAFTGANQRKIGRVEAANGGTLFLDEIGDLPLESQASLLRFLQERKVERLGGHGSTSVDVRIISATHVEMQTAMVEGRFRADLYHRLCVLQIDEPPLRARGKDIELLAKHMLDRYKKDAHRPLRGFAPDAVAALHNYSWPGNVRELINRVRRAIVMAEGRLIGAHDLELGEFAEPAPTSLAQAREAGERQAIEMALLRNRGRLGEAAKELGVSRVTLYRILSAYSMRDATTSPGVDVD